ncbi:MAG: hypothetical protein A2286_03965 [Gammaproteobacteria bacterium RIFOXYA12_FULL_61_12]|nr:MAG: hypothetical protein A2514_14530 [Gammaproteobacteria bacterium RIFOXYD12_FULL_61_37]OGT94454.1 MAG: hypothetical protein A2286_03965 [Gammaproteobacteria bacterium RIFOXYA12_FULL_61_12]
MLAFAGIGQANAAMEPSQFPQETRLVRFVFDENRTFDVLTQPNAITDIKMSSGETLVAFALGDTVQWVYDQAPGHIFIKPSRENLYTSATLVTDKRTYQLQLRSMPADGNWYQRVSWEYPSLVVARAGVTEQSVAPTANAEAGDIASPDKLSFGYRVKGKAPFTPTNIFDDGERTWLRLPHGIQDTPAAFIRENGKLVLVNYSMRGDYMVVQRVIDELVLKAGKSEVVVKSEGKRNEKRGQGYAWSHNPNDVNNW